MRLGPDTAAVMRKASRGPAAIALRQSRIINGALVPTNASAGLLIRGGSMGALPQRRIPTNTVDTYLRNPRRVPLGVLYRAAGSPIADPFKLGFLGAGAAVQVGSAVAGKVAAGGATSIAADMGAGVVAGPIGLVIGAIVGIVISKIFNKQYLDVTSANSIADASLSTFRQYQTIAGQVAGRQIGLSAMNAIWKGAMYAGLFPLNNQQLCFHNGCLKYKGQPEWIEATINGPDNQFTLGGVYNNFLMAARSAATPTVNASVSPIIGTTATGARYMLRGLGSRGRRPPFAGLGALGAINGVPEAVVLVDQYLIPANTRDNPAWLVPQSALEHQILYDVADAWLAQKHPELNTTPFISIAPTPTTAAPVPAPSPNPVPAPITPIPISAPAEPAPVIPPPALPGPITVPVQSVPGGSSSGGGLVPYYGPTASAPVTPISATTPGGPTVATASLGPSEIFSNPLVLLILGGMALAIVPPMLKSSKEST